MAVVLIQASIDLDLIVDLTLINFSDIWHLQTSLFLTIYCRSTKLYIYNPTASHVHQINCLQQEQMYPHNTLPTKSLASQLPVCQIPVTEPSHALHRSLHMTLSIPPIHFSHCSHKDTDIKVEKETLLCHTVTKDNTLLNTSISVCIKIQTLSVYVCVSYGSIDTTLSWGSMV